MERQKTANLNDIIKTTSGIIKWCPFPDTLVDPAWMIKNCPLEETMQYWKRWLKIDRNC